MGPYELIVVDDGSTDKTPQLLEAAAREDSALRVITHRRNRGYGASLKTGIMRTTADLIVITDADQSYPNDRIPDLLELAGDADMVVGSRNGPAARHSYLRRLPKLFLRLYASWIAGTAIPDLNSGLRVFRRDVAAYFSYLLSDGFSFTTTITLTMLCNNYVVHYEPVDYSPRVGKSKIRPIRDTLRFLQLIVRAGLCFAPLRVLIPCVLLVAGLLGISVAHDVISASGLTSRTVTLFGLGANVALFTMLADVVHIFHKRMAAEIVQSKRQTLERDVELGAVEAGDRRPSRAA
jgi:glycosyltransferase involved in cell wall biosynthesis